MRRCFAVLFIASVTFCLTPTADPVQASMCTSNTKWYAQGVNAACQCLGDGAIPSVDKRELTLMNTSTVTNGTIVELIAGPANTVSFIRTSTGAFYRYLLTCNNSSVLARTQIECCKVRALQQLFMV
jgi:hypothetical protein